MKAAVGFVAVGGASPRAEISRLRANRKADSQLHSITWKHVECIAPVGYSRVDTRSKH